MMLTRWFYICLTVVLLAACAAPTPPPLIVNTATPRAVGQPDNPLRDEGTIPNADGLPEGVSMNVLIDLPPNYTPDAQDLPVMVFLHDDGPQGSDIDLIRPTQRPLFLTENAEDYPFILVVPQLPEGYIWSEVPATLLTALEAVHNQYPTDRSRTYLTGHGLGAYGVLELSRLMGPAFSAAAASSFFYVGQIQALCEIDMPLRLYHSADDTVVLPSAADRVINGLDDCGTDYTYIALEGYTHAQTNGIVFNDKALYDWLLSHD